MKPPLTGLLLLSVCGLSSWSVSSGPHVITPDYSVMEGDTANISCCLKESLHPIVKARVTWLRNGTMIKSMKDQSVNTESNHCLILTLSNITREDSGRYACKLTVEIPIYNVLDGSETVITVRDKEIPEDAAGDDTFDGASDDPQVLTHIMRCLPVLALFITFIYLYHSLSKAQSHTPAGPGNKPTSNKQKQEERPSENERREEREEEDNMLSDN